MFLREKWFFCFLPPKSINKYTVYAYKVMIIEPGANSLTFRRLEDNKPKKITVLQATKNLLTENEYIAFAKANGFDCSARSASTLSFCRRK